ncbi:chromodomain Y-like protein 2 isoform X2 [Physella acuta]|uniref:chromodomain Y-like protein 2 isoform X2 n=1 Tax=Physella acuta TaxID=109671 RepID=UPI0027DDD95C|nr:chromodomain Y-like protein 2 isoform X2 [Physella acuta]
MADQQLYEVEQILGKKVLPSRRVLYLVRWRGFSSDHDSWEPYQNLDACRPLINIFNQHIEDTQGIAALNKSQIILKPADVDKTVHSKHTHLKYSAIKRSYTKKDKSTPKLSVSAGKKVDGRKKQSKLKMNTTSSKSEMSKTESLNGGGGALQPSENTPVTESPKKKNNIRKRKLDLDNTDKSVVKNKKSKLSISSSTLNNKTEHSGLFIKENVLEDDSDDDILYSLNSDCDSFKHADKNEKSKYKLDSKGKFKTKKTREKLQSSVIKRRSPKLTHMKDLKVGSKRKKMFLIDSKKKDKDFFSQSVKHLMSGQEAKEVSVLSGESLLDPVSAEDSETYLADVPTSYPVPAEEPVVNDQSLSSGSLSYKSLLSCLPHELHLSHKDGKKSKNGGSNGESASSSHLNVPSTLGQEPVERRTSIRSTECAFRYKQIVVKKCLRYTQIWLNTQTVMQNALNPQVIQEVVSALNSAKYDDSHLVLFSSLGNVFCSGTDLHFLVSGDRKMSARQMTDAIRELTKTFITFPKPIIAAVSGAVVGLGVSLIALCDVVYASDKASFHLPYSQLSQTPEGCSSFTLPLTVGLPSANELLYGGRKITAMEAYQQGLISQVFWPTLMMQEVIPRAQNMATCSAKALEATKLLVRSHHRTKMELTNETECNLLLERWTSVDCQRAIEAYLSNEKNLSF